MYTRLMSFTAGLLTLLLTEAHSVTAIKDPLHITNHLRPIKDHFVIISHRCVSGYCSTVAVMGSVPVLFGAMYCFETTWMY